MSDTIQRRFLPTGSAAVLVAPSRRPGDTIGTLRGYAARFNVLSVDMGGWRERLERGAFTAALASASNILALYDHAPGQLLGSTAARTLTLAEDGVGLRFEIDLPDTTVGRDVLILAQRGDLRGMSFGFTVGRDGTRWEKGTNGEAISVVRTVRALREISVVSVPAYPAAGIEGITIPDARPVSAAQSRARAAISRMREAVAAAS